MITTVLKSAFDRCRKHAARMLIRDQLLSRSSMRGLFSLPNRHKWRWQPQDPSGNTSRRNLESRSSDLVFEHFLKARSPWLRQYREGFNGGGHEGS